MTAANYTGSPSWRPEPPEALAIFCSDGRWAPAFDELLRRHLRLRRYDRYAVPGGPACLASQAGRAARDHITLLVRYHRPQRIVVITHSGCALYQELIQADAEECLRTQEQDLRLAVATLRGWFPGVTVEGYLATRSGNTPTFALVEET
jgi:hypothetical protein